MLHPEFAMSLCESSMVPRVTEFKLPDYLKYPESDLRILLIQYHGAILVLHWPWRHGLEAVLLQALSIVGTWGYDPDIINHRNPP